MKNVSAVKMLESMRRNPVGWRIEQLQAVAKDNFVD